jgi:hypothetical protein
VSFLGRDRRRRGATALAAATAILVISFADYLIADARITDVPVSDCDRTLPSCNDAVNAELEERITRAVELEGGLDDRSYAYMGALSLVALLFAVAAARAPTAAERLEGFRDLGTGTVGLLIAGALVLAVISGGLIQFPARIVFVPALVGVLLAAVGSLVNRSGREEPRARGTGDVGDAASSRAAALLQGRAPATIGFAALGLTVILAVAGASGAATCESAADPSSDTLLALAAVAGVVAIVSGIALLAMRRWLGALALVALPPLIGIYTLLVSFCWN